MKKIETSIAHLVEDITNFYDETLWHYITVSAVDLGDGLEMQYFFARYGVKEEIVCYYAIVGYEEEVPSIIPIISSAYLGEGEVVDMFGANIKGVSRGTFLDPDSIKTPLRKNNEKNS